MANRFTVLYVDDDDQVREALTEIIELSGYKVLVAHDGYEAIRVLMDNHVDLLLTDAVMPGLSGFELAQQAKLLRPHLHILYLTGHDEQAAGREGQLGKILRKPLRAAQIVAEIRLALES
jgi:DNA-binding response OmpR family regulator